jgi:hypothetical protein
MSDNGKGNGNGSGDDDTAAFEAAERLRTQKIHRLAGLVWAGLGIAAIAVGLVRGNDLGFFVAGAVALMLATRFITRNAKEI